MLAEPLSPLDAKHLMKEILETGSVRFDPHARQRMRERDIMIEDVVQALRSGVYREAEWQGSWRYPVDAYELRVVFVFDTETMAVIVTVIDRSR